MQTLQAEVLQEAISGAEPFKVEAKGNGVNALCVYDFLAKEIPPREMLLEPFLPAQGLAMIYAMRGVGKSWMSLEIGCAVAGGGFFLKWSAPSPRRVLLIDGEMPAVSMQERISQVVSGKPESHVPQKDMLRIINPDMQSDAMPDLSSASGQESIAEHVEWADLIIVDNISTLCRSGRENEAESWLPVQTWALDLRRQGKSVLFIHHANKGGGQRGSIRKEDVLDSVIALRKPQDYESAQGARFEVHFEKHRGFHGEAASPFEARLIVDERQTTWAVAALEDCRLQRVASLSGDGMSNTEIAAELGVSKSTVTRDIQKAKEGGLL